MSSRILHTLLLLFLSLSFSASELDSLLLLVKKQNGVEREASLNRIIYINKRSDNKKAEEYATLALNGAMETYDKKGLGDAYNNLGAVYYFSGEYTRAIDNYLKSFLYRQQLQDTIGMGNNLSNIGVMYRKLNNFDKALEYYQRALQLKELSPNKAEAINTINNIGGLYYYQHNFEKSREYYLKALSLAEGIQDTAVLAAACNNLGLVSDDEKDYPAALKFLARSQLLRKSMNDQVGLAAALNNTGRVYEHQQKYEEALAYYNQASEIYTSLGDNPDYANTLFNVGNILLAQKKYKESIKYFEKSAALAKTFENRLQLRDNHNRMGIAQHYLGNHDESYFNLMRYIDLNDSIYDQQSLDKITEMEVKYQSEKKQKENEILKKENELKNLQQQKNQEKQRTITISFIAGLILVVSIALVFYLRYNAKRKNAEQLELFNKEVLDQKALVDVKNKEITDSIHYAQKIQSAMLPPMSSFTSLLHEAFVYFKPKDIVSGDFYWITKKTDAIYFAAVDCTGHGVPGGFMSVLGSSLLDEVVNSKNITEPSDALDLMRVKIINSLKQTGASGENKDGMDMALCKYIPATNELVYAGANNDLYLIRNNKIQKFKACNQAVGINPGETIQFNQYHIKLQKEDVVYIFTDGFADQFGGPKGKKLKYRQLEEFLASIHRQPMERQEKLLDEKFSEWKGKLEQVDDVCIIGVRF
ncbi:MAG: tetratricopeptide repeat protein [Bacteroidia bacterium]